VVRYFCGRRRTGALGPDVRSSSCVDEVLRQDTAVVARDGARVQPAHQV
jgi:hypothetical protein